MKRLLFGFSCALLLSVATPVVAHHSPAAFDRTKEVKLAGTVTGFKWSNPHSWIEIDVANDKGVVETWGVEMTSPTYLVRAGWKSTTVKPGDKVTILVNPVRTGENAGIFLSVTLADGRVLTERPARLGQP